MKTINLLAGALAALAFSSCAGVVTEDVTAWSTNKNTKLAMNNPQTGETLYWDSGDPESAHRTIDSLGTAGLAAYTATDIWGQTQDTERNRDNQNYKTERDANKSNERIELDKGKTQRFGTSEDTKRILTPR